MPARAGVAGFICDTVAQEGLKKILGAFGIDTDVTDVAYEAAAEYLKNPDDAKLGAAMNSLTQGVAGLVFPEYGVALKAGQVVVGGVNYTIEEAQELQLDAFTCGGFSYGSAFNAVDFWSLNAVQQKVKGLNCRNFADRVQTLQQMAELKSIWDGYYTRQLLEMGGRQNEEDLRFKLYKAWSKLDEQWRIKTGAQLYYKLGAALRIEARRLQENPPKSCPAPAGSTMFGDPRTEKGNYVDRCYAFASGCDDNNIQDASKKPSAMEFCRRKGYKKATDSKWSYKAPTEIQSSGQICPDPKGCGGLDFVSCGN